MNQSFRLSAIPLSFLILNACMGNPQGSSVQSAEGAKSEEGFLPKEEIVNIMSASQLGGSSYASYSDDASEQLPEAGKSLRIDEFRQLNLPAVAYDLDDNSMSLTANNTSVDLRKWDTPVRNQGSEGLCTAFGTAAAMENLAKQRTGHDYDLSERHLWNLYGVGNLFNSTAAATQKSIVSEQTWPYYSSNPVASTASNGLMRISEIGNSLSLRQIIQYVQDNKPVVWGGQSPIFNSQGVVHSYSTQYAHAMAVVGVQYDAKVQGGGYFIIKNSWGPDSGDKGYIYMPFYYCSVVQCYAQPILEVAIADVKSEPNQPSRPDRPIETTPTTAKKSCLGANGKTKYKDSVVTKYNGGFYTCNDGLWSYSETAP